jgi:(p)ppGpp synthase/HD superfamily hydrolase
MLFNPLIEQAIELSAQWHDGTYRKGRWRPSAFEVPDDELLRVPTMAHVTAVAMTVQRADWDDTTVAAAFLHDVLEDANRYRQSFRREQMIELVGEAVTLLVEAVSEQKLDVSGNFRSWRDRKEGYIETLSTAPPEAIAISLADKLHNLWSMSAALQAAIDVFSDAPGRRGLGAGPAEQLWFNEAVLTVSEHHTDERLRSMRDALKEQIHVFSSLTAVS